MKYLLILTFLFMTACTSQPKKHTYLRYAGYIEGCVNGLTVGIVGSKLGITSEYIDYIQHKIDAVCMELHLLKLEKEKLEHPMKR